MVSGPVVQFFETLNQEEIICNQGGTRKGVMEERGGGGRNEVQNQQDNKGKWEKE